MDQHRRRFLKDTSLTLASGILLPTALFAIPATAKKIRVLVWDERSDSEKEAYDNYLGNYIADQLKQHPEFVVQSAGLDDTDQGISENALDNTDVLLWWGHTRQNEVSAEKGMAIVNRIKAGRLALIAMHSAHWSTPFVQAMNERTKINAEKSSSLSRSALNFIPPAEQYIVPKYDSRVTPYLREHKFPDGRKKIDVYLPICCFPAYRNDGKPSTVKVLRPEHPIMKGLPQQFVLPRTEMYDEPFHVPAPDEVLFEESWATGEWFRSGMIWNLGAGKVFYFRPGHETFPVFKEKNVITILSNAVKWLAR